MNNDDNTPLDLFDLFSTNKESEEDGVWVALNAKTGFKIRAFNAKAVSDLREKLMKPYQTLVRAGLSIPDEKNEEIGLKVISGAVLSAWRGIVVDGEEISYTQDAAYTLLKKLPKLANFIASNAMESANFREEQKEDNAGN